VTLGTVAVEEALLALKIAFLVLLYLFIWRIVRTASRDLRSPQESILLTPEQSAAVGLRDPGGSAGRLVVLKSPALRSGSSHTLNSAAITAGRSSENDLELANDDYASSHHARFEPRGNGVWVEDAGSTNGTYVNGVRLKRPRKLAPGDVIRVGETDLRFER
jgi:hypothetical protein